MRLTIPTIAAVLLGCASVSALPQNPAASVLSEAIATMRPTPNPAVAAFSELAAIASLASQAKPKPTPTPPAPPANPKPMCKYILTASNQEGGGGPGQGAINNWFHSFTITDASGKQRYSKTLNWDLEYNFSVGRGDYSGTHNMWVSASYRGTSYEWTKCNISFDGGKAIAGTGGDQPDIDTNYVSTITTKCTVKHEC